MTNIEYENFKIKMSKKCAKPEFLQYIEDFIKQGMKKELITRDNLSYVTKKLENIYAIVEFPEKYRKSFGITTQNPKGNGVIVFLNPSLDDFRREQYAFREFAHVVMDKNIEIVEKEVKTLFAENMTEEMINGYTVLEEAIAQEISEELIYSLYNRERPKAFVQSDPAIPKIKYYSNFHYSSLYQPIAVQFAKTLRGIGLKTQIMGDAESVHLHDLCERAMKPGFVKNIIDEYTKESYRKELYSSFYELGVVYGVKQATFGLGKITLDEQNISKSELSYKSALERYSALEDHMK